ncbi:unnamed protein product [Thelazia callipaeda]|uniref:WD repeat-containing protein 7 n=1 Tax=Thelazia callipaeda TaxID=103827 RepID=A0A158RD43_THECL|nr:unnamed protein product [Thelazia callipaeda]
MTSTTYSNLTVAVALWGKKPPKHRITCIQCSKDGKTIITGAEDGNLIFWEKCDKNLRAKMMMIGHENSITALSATDSAENLTRFVSASADGQLTLWDGVDGRSIDSIFTTYIHRRIMLHRNTSDSFNIYNLYCMGDYSEIVVINPQDMIILFTLSSRVDPDWIAAFTFITLPTKQDTVLGLTTCGMVKIWTLVDLDKKESPIYETESKNLEMSEICSVSWHPSSFSRFLIFTSNSWQVTAYFSDEQICDGKLLPGERTAIARGDDTICIYQLPRLTHGVLNSGIESCQPSLLMILQCTSPTNYILWPDNISFCFGRQLNTHIICRADKEGNVALWNLDDSLLLESQNGVPIKHPELETSIDCQWKSLKSLPPSICDLEDDCEITATHYVSSQGRLVIGRADGIILLLYICDVISKQLLTSDEELSYRRLYGHSSSVTCFLYPHEEHARYDQQILISGSSDFTVIAWNVNTGSKLCRFCSQGGPILRMLIPPETCNPRILHTICSIAGDNSAALFSLKELKCILLASRQSFPIVDVKWRPLDDFLLLKCEDETVYIWQMETASLERIVSGQMSEDIILACDEQIGISERDDEIGVSQAVQMLRALKNKNISAMKQIATGGRDGKIANTTEKVLELPPPMNVKTMNKASTGLVSLENALSSGESMENKSLSTILMSKQVSDSRAASESKIAWQTGSSLYLDVAKLCMSLLHAWTLDRDLDKICLRKLRLLKPAIPLSYGVVSRQGHTGVFMPTEKFIDDISFDTFASSVRWTISSSLTTSHLVTVIALTNTLMSLRSASFDIAKRNILLRNSQLRSSGSDFHDGDSQLRQGWSLIAALHCCLLPDLIKPKNAYCSPRIELWQDRCLEVRMAAQALLTRELTRLSVSGRKRLLESWSAFLPTLLDPTLSIFGNRALVASMNSALETNSVPQPPPIPQRIGEIALPDPTINVDIKLSKEAGVQQIRRNQATSLILLGVIGAEFPDEMSKVVYLLDISRATAQSLLELLIAPPSILLPLHSPLRRAAVDLIGRGFGVWQPHLDISKLLLILLELATATENQSLDMTSAILTPSLDVCRTARHTLSLIATSRPPAVITALSKEVARYNSVVQHQTIQHSATSPLLKSRVEVLRIIELLSEKEYTNVVDLIIPVYLWFYMVSYCPNTRRIAFGGRNGIVVVHELRAAKVQTLQAHKGAVTSVAFSEDGKFLATYGAEEAKLLFWQTSQTFLGMGQSQLKCVRSLSAPGIFPVFSPNGTSQPFRARLVWISHKSVTLMLPSNKEYRFAF